MGHLTGYDEADKRRIVNIASQLVAGKIERGEIPETDDAIRAAMPDAVRDAKQTVNAMWEFLAG
jgi:hypothetical protein